MILASKSPRRKELLKQLGYDFRVETLDSNEEFNKELSVYEAIQEVAKDKMITIHEKYYDEIVIGADTIIYFENSIIGKPKNYDDAFNTLKRLSGKKHEVISGVCVAYKNNIKQFYEVSEVYFNKLSDEEIIAYLNTNEYCDKAGSYAIQGKGKKLVKELKGSYNNVVGLPIERLKKVIENMLK